MQFITKKYYYLLMGFITFLLSIVLFLLLFDKIMAVIILCVSINFIIRYYIELRKDKIQQKDETQLFKEYKSFSYNIIILIISFIIWYILICVESLLFQSREAFTYLRIINFLIIIIMIYYFLIRKRSGD
jgi:L-asparagine transporter-like permease